MINENNQDFVYRWLPNENRVERVKVTLDNGKLVEGMEDGDWLVTAGASELTDGDKAVRWIKERGL